MKVNLTYFKNSGKYYCEGNYQTKKIPLFEIWEEVRNKKVNGNLPGVEGATEFIVLIKVPNHPHDHPKLIL